MVRVVVSLTTLPGRYSDLDLTLQSIQSQTLRPDAVYLSLPKIAKRTGEAYPPLPHHLRSMCEIVDLDTDYGPICKLVGGLIMEDDPSTIVITIDDDTIYDPTFLEVIVEKSKRFPGAAICGNGARFIRGPLLSSMIHSPKPARPLNGIGGFPCDEYYGGLVDVVYGMGGVAYRRGMFPTKNSLFTDFVNLGQDKYNLYRQDDVMISGYLSRQGIDRRVFLDIPPVSTVLGSKDCITPDIVTMIKGVSGAIEEGKEMGFFPEMYSVPLSNTMIGNLGLGIFYLALIVAVGYAAYVLSYVSLFL